MRLESCEGFGFLGGRKEYKPIPGDHIKNYLFESSLSSQTYFLMPNEDILLSPLSAHSSVSSKCKQDAHVNTTFKSVTCL